jgi:antitoxin (DNA-binding transcriptional repressor) of toxin-antitoxin stability system
MRIDWNALELEYMEAGNEVTIESLALKHGIPIARLSRRAEKDNWEWCPALFRRRMEIP